CPGITENDSVDCPVNTYWNGDSCVGLHDCPCVSDDVVRQTGSVWKEDNGCTNCICIAGISKCTPQICDITSCGPGFKLVTPAGACCPICEVIDTTCLDGSKYVSSKVGQTWTENCEDCICTDTGVICNPVQCPPVVMPICGAGYELVQKVGGCCPVYECVCDKDACDTVMPICEKYFEPVPVDMNACCPKYQCACKIELCPSVFCSVNERKIRTNAYSACCPEYLCEPLSCVDGKGVKHEVGSTFVDPLDSCSQCSCLADGVISCLATQCDPTVISVCPSGAMPVKRPTADGCCVEYVCDCMCSGLNFGWNTFDAKYMSDNQAGVFTVAKDTNSKDFAISISKVECDSGMCIDYIYFEDFVEIDGGEVAVSSDKKTTIMGFVLSMDASGGVQAKSEVTGVSASISSGGMSWSVTMPADYRGSTVGLCGQCDGDCTNELWDGTKSTSSCRVSVTLQSHHTLYHNPKCALKGINAKALFPVLSTAAQSVLTCTLILVSPVSAMVSENGIFCPCGFVAYETAEVHSCISYLLHFRLITTFLLGGNECDALCQMASACRANGHCIEWRTDVLCPYTCPSNKIYKACGPNVVKTCENYKTYSTLAIEYTSEGCFCPDNLVYSNGACISPVSCPVCTDELGNGRYTGEFWKHCSDPCITCTCTAEGNIVQSSATCAAQPECAADETKVLVANDVCCPVYECVPTEKCQNVVCPTYPTPVCGAGEEVQSVVHDECCVEFKCVCNSDLCPIVQVTCEEGEEITTVSDKCCESSVCECRPETCPEAPTCVEEGFELALIKYGRCCSTYECRCTRATCPVEEMLVCDLGEVKTVKNPGECCTKYECVCDKSTCPVCVTTCPSGYKIKTTTLADKCCSEITECVCDESACPTYKGATCDASAGYKAITTGSVWPAYRMTECCPVIYEEVCVCDKSLCPTSTQPQCESYQTMVEVPTSSCCTEYQCICDVSRCSIGVTSCPCNKHVEITRENECCELATCICNTCTEPQTCNEGWTATDTVDDCDCITRTCTPPTKCVYNAEEHAPGSTWQEDICLECCCPAYPNAAGEYVAECTNIQCGKCSSGYTYVPIPGACCGDCVPITCHYEGTQHSVGQTWSPAGDLCTTCTCNMNSATGEVFTTCTAVACAPMDPSCPADKIMTTPDGCCTYCDPSTFQFESGCMPKQNAPEYLTLDGCTSVEQVCISTCEGSCVSKSIYSLESNNFTKACSCCSTSETEERTAEFSCPDGSTKTVTYKVATKCSCQASKCEAMP
uniref:von Willebrand factor n=1 Tax=Ciona savignyi TaxID=51511 RepID=H2Y4W6_CIOSA